MAGVGIQAANSGDIWAYTKMADSLRETGFLSSVKGCRRTDPFQVRLISPEFLDVEFARSCLNYCRKNHGKACIPQDAKSMPFFRVIDCETRAIIADCQYVALSYFWGASTTSISPANDIAPTPSILPSIGSSPKPILDSIEVTLSLKLRYLWVGRYRINQLDELEKHDQIRKKGFNLRKRTSH